MDRRDKNEIFKSLLLSGERIEYLSHGTKFALIVIYEKNGYFVCRLGKQALIRRHLPPDQNFEETLEESWPSSLVVINTNSNEGAGQKIAFEYKPSIFTNPHKQLKHLENKINDSLIGSGYALAVNPVTEEQEFWEIIDNYQDKIEKLSFNFNVPNLFGLDNTLTQDLKVIANEYGSTRVSIELENPAGKLKIPKNDLTNQSIEYITRGGGEYGLRVKGKVKKTLKSRNKTYTRTFDNLDITIRGKEQKTLFNIIDRIFK